MKRVYTDRSRIESFQRCNRLRFLEYHQDGMGITSSRKPLPLALGGSVHVALATLLIEGSKLPLEAPESAWRIVEEAAVCAFHQDFKQHQSSLQVDVTEGQAIPEAQSAFDQYLLKEQSALGEGITRAYRRRKLRPLLEQFEVLEVEREGQWLLSEWADDGRDTETLRGVHQVWFMSRPDALLRERASNQLYLLSFKTAAAWDIRKARDAEHDMQGLSEGIEVERRLAEWWELVHPADAVYHRIVEEQAVAGRPIVPQRMAQYLRELDSPPRILAVRYEYMLKGQRWQDKELSQLMGFECRVQRSPLVRGYLNVKSDIQSEWNCSWDYLKPDGTGESSKLNYRQWKSEPVWEHMTVVQWIDMLADSGEATSGDTGQPMGIKSAAQQTGYLAHDPLDELFIPPIVIYRNEDDLRDLVEQMESQERGVAEHVALVEAAADESERRSLLNQYFPMSRHSCEYPSTCMAVKICYGGEDIRRNPLGSGLYTIRVPNHPQEAQR